MRRVTLVAILGFGMMGESYAQSSVALYGVIDEGVDWVSNVKTTSGAGASQVSVAGGILQSSRWGLRGTEDLGGRVKALFVLESGFDPSTGQFGQGGLEFGRQAYVGLSGSYGTVTLGRQYDLVVDSVGPFVAGTQWGGIVAAHGGDVDNLVNTWRINNAVKYASPEILGIKFGAMYSLGGVAGDFTRGQIWSFGATYRAGPASLGAAYLNVRQPNISFFGNSTSGTPSAGAANNPNPIFSGFLSAHTYQTVAVGGSYGVDRLTVGGTYSYIRFSGLGDLTAGPNPRGFQGGVTFNNVEVNARYQITPALVAGVAYDYLRQGKVSPSDGATYHTASAALDYFLSKRTDVYLLGVMQHAIGAASTGGEARANLTTLGASSSGNQILARVGLRHKF
ncbi:porin [Paraburkholderia caribensis]|uniref:porin n=1 Tax=Paraburkholderia caribensis TaxID=75105 RepID=UPI001CB15024|nr:Porin [Paraburkholderia caribensis]